ncbi:MAG TPA: tryptophan synthase subunit alpha, partial [Desulfuromonadaceae bacterium]
LVDMPPEESREFLAAASAHGLNVVFLLTPTSDKSRIATVAELGKGFVYYVTVTGVTGARQEVSTSLAAELGRIRKKVRLPIVAGFGISTPEQAASVADMADGVVVGSAIVKLFQQYSGKQLRAEVRRFVSALKQAISAKVR